MTREEFEAVEAEFYGTGDEETLSHEGYVEVLIDCAERWYDRDMTKAQYRAAIADHEYEVVAFTHRILGDADYLHLADNAMENADEWFDSECDDPDGGPGSDAEITSRHDAARQLFVEAMKKLLDDRRVYWCDRVAEYTYAGDEVVAILEADGYFTDDEPLHNGEN